MEQPGQPNPGSAPPPPQPQYGPPPAPPPGPGYPPPPMGGMAPYGYMPADGNTSGYGEGYPVPPSVKGWSFAGFIPYGIFAFVNNSGMWGAFGIVAQFLGLGLVYAIVIGIMGREIAWKARRFNSLTEFEDTMRAWNNWGLIVLCAGAVLIGGFVILYFTMILSIFALAFSSAAASGM